MTRRLRMTSAQRLLSCAALLILQAGCDVLEVENPDIIDPTNLDSPEGAEARRVGALADFAVAKDGDASEADAETDGYILVSGLMSDEFVLSTTPPSQQEIDQRRVNPTTNVTSFDLYLSLHRARAAAEQAAAALRQYSTDPDNDPGIAETHSVAGFSYIFFGEGFCSGVPYSRVVGDSLVFGAPETTGQTFERAVAQFDSALAHPGVTVTIGRLAAIGKGRALLNLARFDEAELAVPDIPTSFRYVTEHADTPERLRNAIFLYGDSYLWSVSDGEGGAGLLYRTVNDSAGDPRVPYFDTEDVGLDNTTPQFTLLKYPSTSAPVVTADGIEARLIEAEAALQRGDLAGMTTILNELRSGEPDLDNLAAPGTQDEAVDLLFSERAFWLFATGHRLGDMRRLIRQYGRPVESVFPTGPYLKGGLYGEDVNMPIPTTEQNNPNFQGCLDRNA